MTAKPQGLRVLDLFCGAGGFSEGFRQAGFDVVAGVDNWLTALHTYEYNGLGKAINLNMTEAIQTGGHQLVKKRLGRIKNEHGRIDVLIGSPPCTEFSYSKNGGHGDLERGMHLVRANLVFLAALRPLFWLLENVPRLESAIDQEKEDKNSKGWYMSLRKLGVREDISDWPYAKDGRLVIPYGKTYDASEFNAPQRRLRFIVGSVSPDIMDSKKVVGVRSMGDCIHGLETQVSGQGRHIVDPNYSHHKIPKSDLRDYGYESTIHPMYWEELRHLKTRHIQYGSVPFPDDLSRPSRTVMSTQNVTSRESIVLDAERKTRYQGKMRPVLKHLRVREAACLQGFPLGFQFAGSTLNARAQQIGNAVPCQLSYALALGILDQFVKSGHDSSDSDGQQLRFDETMRRRAANDYLPIIRTPLSPMLEAKDFRKKRYREFRARPDKHIRRKLLSSKMDGNSAVVIFENTEWIAHNKHHGGFWKSCIQVGVGKEFSQVYLDETSVRMITEAIDQDLGGRWTGNDQMMMEKLVPDDYAPKFRKILCLLMHEIDRGIPLVDTRWPGFPGYLVPKVDEYVQLTGTRRRPLPAASYLQTLFTSSHDKTNGSIGPIDLFDGLDALALKILTKPDSRWILRTNIQLRKLTDCGKSLHGHRISPKALCFIDGSVPLTTLLMALMSIHVLYRMHAENQSRNQHMFKSLKRSWSDLTKWSRCG